MQGRNKLSPIRFANPPLKTEYRNGWEVPLTYGNNNVPLAVIDLSHIPKFEIYSRQLAGQTFGPLRFPHSPGEVILTHGFAVGLCRQSVALSWNLCGPREGVFGTKESTEVTDGYALLGLIGADGPRLMEKITDLDLGLPFKHEVHLVQGPVLGALSKVMVFSPEGGSIGILVAVARGSGPSVADAILDAGIEFGLQPAGQDAFNDWFRQFSPFEEAGGTTKDPKQKTG